MKPNKRCNTIHKKTKESSYGKEKEHNVNETTSGITFTTFQTTFLSEAFSLKLTCLSRSMICGHLITWTLFICTEEAIGVKSYEWRN